MLKVNEAFYSIQGEGSGVGLPAIFIRLAGCNMACSFCDTKHDKGEDFSVSDIVEVASTPSYHQYLPVVLTGGEPLMQRESGLLIDKFLCQKRRVIVETNGSYPLTVEFSKSIKPHYLHICVSPKVPFDEVRIMYPGSVKLLYPFIKGLSLTDYFQSTFEAQEVFIQPIDNNKKEVKKVVELLKFHPRVRLSVQVHKIFNLM